MSRARTMRLLLALFAMSVVGLAAGQAAQAGGWGGSFGVSPPANSGTSVEDASVLARDDGGFIYVWADTAGSTAGVKTRVVAPDGSLGPIRNIAPGFSLSIPFFADAAGTDGKFRLVYGFRSQSCPACYFSYSLKSASLDDDGQIVGTPQTIDEVGPGPFESLDYPSLSVAADGSALLAWEHAGNPTRSLGLAWAPSGGDFSSRLIPPGAYSAHLPVVAAKDGGGGFVGYTNNGGDAMAGMMVAANGDTTDPEQMADGTNGDVPRAVIDSTGRATVAFVQYKDSNYGVWMRQMDPGGVPIGPGAAQVDSGSGNVTFYDGSLAVSSSNVVAVGWSEYDGVNHADLRSIGNDGTMAGIQQIGDPSFDVREPTVAFDGATPVAFFAQGDYGADTRQILAQPLTSALAPDGAATPLADYKANDSIQFAEPSFSASGDASVAWTGTISDSGYGRQLDAAIYDASGPTVDTRIPTKTTQGFETVMAADGSDRSGPVSLSWSFGDGGTAAGRYVKHAFASTGTFEVKVTATDGVGNETVETVPVEVVAVPQPKPGPVAPDTTITAKPGKKVKARTATFKFTSDQAGATFECRLDRAGWSDCRSPKKLKKLRPGKHTFRVRAIKGDLFDRTPASHAWTVQKPKKKRR
ncbi:MAG: PKD domain-containing protein [Solirubrobacterales bacterium]|nr:PKD domain-containing protein [Solirubrobacterales bacterium]